MLSASAPMSGRRERGMSDRSLCDLDPWRSLVGMDDVKVAVVWNPTKADEPVLRKALDEASVEARWYQTSEADPGQGAVQSALNDGAGLVLVAGGDGTVRAAAGVLAGSGVRLGIVPSGTGNLLARNLGLPLNDVGEAVRVGLGTPGRAIDVGWAETGGARHAFVVMAGFGIDSRMIVETDDELKSKAGWLAYVAALGKAMGSADLVPVTYTIDDEGPVSTEAHTVIVGNCGTVQGGLTILPDAVPDDGILNVIVLGADTVGQWLETLKTAVWDNGILRWFRDDGAVSGTNTDHLSGRRIEVTAAKPVTFEVDGDDIGDVTAVTITVAPGSLEVSVPLAPA